MIVIDRCVVHASRVAFALPSDTSLPFSIRVVSKSSIVVSFSRERSVFSIRKEYPASSSAGSWVSPASSESMALSVPGSVRPGESIVSQNTGVVLEEVMEQIVLDAWREL